MYGCICKSRELFLIPSNKRNVFILIVTCNYYSGWLLVILDPNGSVLITLKCDLTTHKNIALLLFLWWASYPEGRDKVRYSLSCATFLLMMIFLLRGWFLGAGPRFLAWFTRCCVGRWGSVPQFTNIIISE
jgi:hypothetical protein